MSLHAEELEPEPAVLEANRLRVVLDLAARLTSYEMQFGLLTSDLESAIQTGQVVESADVTDWLIGYRTLSIVIGPRPAPGE
jgi:hypothetical protein